MRSATGPSPAAWTTPRRGWCDPVRPGTVASSGSSTASTSADAARATVAAAGSARSSLGVWVMTRSYSHGASSVPLLGETIGENLERTAARSAERDALVVPFQDVRLTYRRFDAEVDRVARGLLAGGLARATGSASGARTTPSGCWSSTPRPRSA